MTNQPSQAFQKLREKLHEIFQLDRADLDFGIYRIMNMKRDQIVRFLDKDLLPQVKAALAEYEGDDKAGLQRELDEAIIQARNLGVDPETLPKVKDLRARIASSSDATALENEVYSHLFNFFRRYFCEGDFISQRRYKEGVYAIPYEGEEVKLHWANHDQYYVKTSEYFRDYSFRLENGKRVHFKLVEASTEKDNVKEQKGKERRFALVPEDPVAVENGEAVIRFTYLPNPEKQKDLNEQTAATLRANTTLTGGFPALFSAAPTEANPQRTLLEKHLVEYTARNTFDYFIHKNLRKFLRTELDFFIKNEVLHLDDVDAEHVGPAELQRRLAKIKALRRIAHKLIDFLAQIEDFQKKLWLKKKFVVETNYLVTLNRIPEELYPEIAANDRQSEEWVRLFAIDEIKGGEGEDLLTEASPGYSVPLTVEFLKANKGLVVDTSIFSEAFVSQLINCLEINGGDANGVVFHSENFQALSLMQARFHGQMDVTYIDPPYNTGDDGFPYKDAYQHSSWLSMVSDRLALGRGLEPYWGTVTISIDDEEQHRLAELARTIYGSDELVKLVWDRNRKNDARFFSVGHEYMITFARDSAYLSEAKVRFREPKDGIDDARKVFDQLKKEHGEDWEAIRTGWLNWFDDIPVSDPRRRLIRYSKVGERGPYRDDGNPSWPGGGGPKYEILHPVTGKPCKKPSRGWIYPTPERFWEEYEKGRIAFGEDETKIPSIITNLFDSEGQVMPSVHYSYAQTVSQEFDAMMGGRVFDNPKGWRDILRIIRYLSGDEGWVMDYFAGSGTTAQSVIELSRLDGSKRRYTLVEAGDHFDTVLKPRIAKVVYCDTWKDGKPQNRNTGVSHLCKYIRLESYEDALANLAFTPPVGAADLLDPSSDSLGEDYLLRYMLEEETKGSASLLNIHQFADPTAYKLKVKAPGTDETREVAADLLETFNWLIGLRVDHIAAPQVFSANFERDGNGRLALKGERLKPDADGPHWFRTVTGWVPENLRLPHDSRRLKVLIVWRKLTGDPEQDNLVLDHYLRRQRYTAKDLEFDLICVNGDNNLENLKRDDETWKVRLIEEDFHRLMFDVEDV